MILLRHGQSEFNLHFTATRRDPGIKDPKLTPLGHEQAEAAAEAILGGHQVQRIIASPYTRALQTAAPLAKRLGLPVLVQPLVRERYAFACDIGSPRTALAQDWPELDLNHIDEVWWPAVEEPADQVEARARLFRAEMSALADWQHTVVVSHWGFILSMTGQSVTNGQWLRCDPTGPAPESIVWKH
ncbi:histidine phosphatase family protein [Pseudoroseomonas cervicalis]|uniref:Phosphoglycerate mutase family protein n=1 Tax=Pseudoroseomonas cervicalis ATCC 49957 TaxID=525371 RepID=D5RLD5_9PROT|nr:histidine phosphatase family protein [Pseudoroseomonas cervicalis]EFH11891.1 phosphoglycerate mutase family protein [Pseudoroseomonas cervicalis ATCC 49957]